MPTENQTLTMLRALLAGVHTSQSSGIPLTLSTSSGLIRGIAVNPERWAHALARTLRDDPELYSPDETLAYGLSETLEGLATLHGVPPRREQTVESIDDVDVRNIYLVQAALLPYEPDFATRQHPGNQLGCWQVAVNHVAAWTIG